MIERPLESFDKVCEVNCVSLDSLAIDVVEGFFWAVRYVFLVFLESLSINTSEPDIVANRLTIFKVSSATTETFTQLESLYFSFNVGVLEDHDSSRLAISEVSSYGEARRGVGRDSIAMGPIFDGGFTSVMVFGLFRFLFKVGFKFAVAIRVE